jgi:hypothetical protein
MIFLIDDFNILYFDLALKYDNRNLIKIYYSYLMLSNMFIFTFINKADYNNKQLKLCLFLLFLSSLLVFNILFFENKIFTELYYNFGNCNFSYYIFNVISASLISLFLNFLLQYLALSDKYLRNERINGNKNIMKEEIEKKIKIIKIRVTIYFIINFILILIYWYIINAFVIIYKNSIKQLFYQFFLSFILSMIFPFIICLITATIRKISLKLKIKILFYIGSFYYI